MQDGKIVGVGKYTGAAAKRTIDAEGRVVAPGFIDHHTHYDPQAVWDPSAVPAVQNGHTTVIVGQCGQVIAPVRPGDGDVVPGIFRGRRDDPAQRDAGRGSTSPGSRSASTWRRSARSAASTSGPWSAIPASAAM